MRNAIHLEVNAVPALLRGNYTGKMFKACVVTEVTVPAEAGLWSGGSRDTYRLVEMATGREIPASDNMSAPWNRGRVDRKIVLEPGYVVIEHTIFCGKDLGLTFYVHPDNAAKLLPAPAAPLDRVEKMVLSATCGLKSSYMGKDRYEMTRDNARWSKDGLEQFPSRADWDRAKTSLIAKGLLNKAGAVTVAGRNAEGGR
jgi:hypothetical protein